MKPRSNNTSGALSGGDSRHPETLNRTAAAFLALIAFAINKLPYEAYQEVKGRKVQIAAVRHPALLRWGITLLTLGFALSFGATFFQ